MNEGKNKNKYTYAQIRSERSDGLKQLFPCSLYKGYNYWSLKPFTIQQTGSIYADENVFDFYI